MSRFWTRLAPEIVLEAENIAGGFLLPGHFVDPPLPPDQPRSFQLFEVDVQRRSGDFGIIRQLVLRRKAPEIRVVPVAQIPEHQLGHGAKPALWIEQGFSIKEIMTFAGHSSIQMTMERYGHLFPSPDHQKAMAMVEAKLLG